jgi:hypothetical protein
LSLSFIYKDVYYNLISNLKKRTLIVGFIILYSSPHHSVSAI